MEFGVKSGSFGKGEASPRCLKGEWGGNDCFGEVVLSLLERGRCGENVGQT